jgi:hypothetical protein
MVTMSYIQSVLIGTTIGFILNVVPKKVSYILTFGLAIFVIVSFAFLADAKVNIVGNWDWGISIFSFLGYWIGYITAWAVKYWRGW